MQRKKIKSKDKWKTYLPRNYLDACHRQSALHFLCLHSVIHKNNNKKNHLNLIMKLFYLEQKSFFFVFLIICIFHKQHPGAMIQNRKNKEEKVCLLAPFFVVRSIWSRLRGYNNGKEVKKKTKSFGWEL